MKRVNIFQKIKENKAKVAALETYEFAVKGVTAETEEATCFLIDHMKKGLVEKWIPNSVVVSESQNSIAVKGWFAAQHMITLVNIAAL